MNCKPFTEIDELHSDCYRARCECEWNGGYRYTSVEGAEAAGTLHVEHERKRMARLLDM